MTPSSPVGPELLYRKPGTVTTAQVMLWLQFSFLVCCGTGGTFLALVLTEGIGEVDFGGDVVELLEDLAAVAIVIVAAVAATAVLFAVLAVKIGAGRRWAQVTAIVVMLVTFVVGFLGFYTGFEEQTGTPLDGSRLIGTLAGLAFPLVTLICLFTGSANQWFRQGGKDPLRVQPPPPQPPPPQALPPYSPY